MAVTSYTELQAAIAAWMQRNDLTTLIPDFIAIAEAQMNSRLRVNPMIARYTAAIGDEYSAVPDDFLGAVSLSLNDNPAVRLHLLTPDQAEVAAQGNVAGKPAYYAIVGGEFRFYPDPGAEWSAQLTYWQKIPALASAGTNWLLASYPDAYLYGSLAQAALFVRNDERAATWGTLFADALKRIEEASLSNTMGGVLTPTPSGYAV